MVLTGETEVLGEKPATVPFRLLSNPGRRGERP
jgi:hypothetical protein